MHIYNMSRLVKKTITGNSKISLSLSSLSKLAEYTYMLSLKIISATTSFISINLAFNLYTLRTVFTHPPLYH